MHQSSLDGSSFPVQNSAAATTPFTGDSRMRSRLGTTLLAVCTLPLTVVVAQAQNPVSNGIRAMAQRQTKNIVDAAEEMPADKYGYKPTPAQMSYGDVVAHLIKEGNNYLCSAASGMKQPDVDKFTGADPKDKLVAGLKASFKFCETALAQVQDAQLSDSIDFFGGRKVTKALAGLITVADWADHYSQMAIYLRLNGLLPPTAKKGMD
jgi:uncharacterized damage-inducible protein DinB